MSGVAASSYFPDTFNLSDGPVQSVETSETDPRVIYDGAGLRATDAGGHLLFDLDASLGQAQFSGHVIASGLDLSGGPAAATPDQDKVRWLLADGTVVGQVSVNRSSVDGTTTLFADAGGTNYVARQDPGNAVNQILFVQTASGQSRTILNGSGNSDFLTKIDGWHNVPTTGGWSTAPLPQYYSDGNRVYLRGDFVNTVAYSFGQASAVIANLPVGIRPVSATSQIIVPYTDPTNGNGFILVNFNTDGTVTLAGTFQTNATGVVGTRIRMTGQSFRIA